MEGHYIENLNGEMDREVLSCFSDGKDGIAVREPLLRKRTMNTTTSQIAVIGTNICPINESLDYEIVENDQFKQDWRSRKRVQIFQYVVLKWTLALLIGLGTAVVGFFNNLAVENIAGFKLLLTRNLVLEHRYILGFISFSGCNLVLATVCAALCAYIAPAAAGSGIPEVKAYLNDVDAHTILAPTTLFVMIFCSIGGVSAGFVLGNEGPMAYTGACIASLLGRGGSSKYHMTRKWLRFFKNDRDRRDLIICGAAAGVAAAFRAPVGDVLFTLERATSWWRSALLWRTFFTRALLAVVLRSVIEYCRRSKCGVFGQGGLIMFDLSLTITSYSTLDLLSILLLGVIGGIFGSLYNFMLHRIIRCFTIINEKGPLFKIILTMAISLLTSCCAYGLPWLAKCEPCPTNLKEQCPTIGRKGNFKNFQCPPGHYNDLASLFLNTNEDAIRKLFSVNTGEEFRISTLFLFFVAIYFLGLITYGIALPSGLFIPVILAGASYGRIVGNLLNPVVDLDAGIFALLGAASFLGGTVRMTVSVCIILLQLTSDLLMLPLVMLVLLISKTVADSFNKGGVYDQIVKMKGLPCYNILVEAPHYSEPYMRNLVAGDVVVSGAALISFAGIERVGNIMVALRLSGHNGFPVVDEPPFSDAPELCGLVLRSHLLVLLKRKQYFTRRKKRRPAGLSKLSSSCDFFAKAAGGSGGKVEDLDLLTVTDEEMEMYVDLHPVTNTSPYTVVETMSLAKAAVLFRKLGLRHLCVVPKTSGRPPIVGILTRHDFMREHVLGLYPHIYQFPLNIEEINQEYSAGKLNNREAKG